MESEENGRLNFLDCTLNKVMYGNVFSLIFSVFRKPTFTNLGMNFHSFTFYNFKLNNIRTLLHRAFEISSNWHILHNELQFLKGYFEKNGYPNELINKMIRSFLGKKIIPKQAKLTVSKMPLYHNIPFVNNYTCHYIVKVLGTFLSKSYPQVNFNFVFSNTSRIQNLTKHKEKMPTTLDSGIVYEYKCGDCNATYIGSSTKSLRTRASEHFGYSSRSGNMLVRPPPSSIRNHMESCKLRRTLDQFSIIDRQSNAQALRISETMEIIFRKPILNEDQSAIQLYLL